MTDVAEAIDDEAEPVTLRTRGVASYDVKGNGIPGALSAPQTIQAAIQPASGRLLQDLPEGKRTDIAYVGWTRFPVAVGNEIGYFGGNFKVVQIWPRPGDGFTKFAMSETGG